MNIKIKYNKKYINVDVRDKECKNKKCFSLHRYIL